MAEAKTGRKKPKLGPSTDVKARYLQGSMYMTRAMRFARGSSGSSGKRGKTKINVIKGSVPTDEKGWVL